MVTAMKQELHRLSSSLGALDSLLKGYPEFNADQPRDASGKWTSGGGGRSRLREDRQAHEAWRSAPSSRKKINQRIRIAGNELEKLRRAGRKAIKDRDPDRVFEVMRDLGSLKFTIPISDYHAKPIKEGRQLDAKVDRFLAWLDDKYTEHKADFERRRLERSRQGKLGEIIDNMYGRGR